MWSICNLHPETTIKKPANNQFIATNVSLGVFLSSGVFWHMYMQCT